MKLKSNSRLRAGLRLLTAAALGLSVTSAQAAGFAPDLDGDGIPNIVDPDIDADGIPNALDENIDGGIAKTGPYAGQYIGDHVNNDNPAERDIDDDQLADDSLGETDIDGDGKTDNSVYEDDVDGDGRTDSQAAERDMDGDGRLDDEDSREDDIDGDGLDDDDYAENDIDGDNSSDSMDDDIDGDSRGNSVIIDSDVDGDGRANDSANEDDDDGDGAQDRDDDDDNNDGIKDVDDDNHHDEDDEVEQKVTLTPAPGVPSGSSAKVNLQSMATGKVELKIIGDGFPAGNYGVVIAGVSRGTLTMVQDDDKVRGKLEFETGAVEEDELPLDFLVADQAISIVQGQVLWFSGTIPTPPPPPQASGDDDHHHHTFIQPLQRAAGVAAEAKAEAEIDVGIAGVTVFEIEIEGLPPAVYEVRVAGVLRGSPEVVQLPGSTRGQLRCEVEPEGGDEILLNFPVVGLPVTISRNGVTYFSGTVPGGG